MVGAHRQELEPGLRAKLPCSDAAVRSPVTFVKCIALGASALSLTSGGGESYVGSL